MQANDSSHQPQTAVLHARTRFSEATLSKLLIFAAAGLSFVLSVFLYFSGDHERGIFVGLWVPSILSAGSLLHLQTGPRHDG